MRILFFLIAFFSLSFHLFSQNWQLIHKDWVYLYASDEDSVQPAAFSVRALNATTTLAGPDTVFEMNQIVEPIDGQPVDPYRNLRWHKIPAFILGTHIAKDAHVYHSLSDQGKHWPIHIPKDSVWVLDSLDDTRAWVDSIYMGSVLGQIDSLKLILFSTGDTALVSKNHGMIRFPLYGKTGVYAHLVGIEGPGLGLSIPKLKDIFDFEIGDVFYYLRQDVGIVGLNGERWIRREVINKQRIQDTLRYTYQDSISYYWRVTHGIGDLSLRTQTIDYVDSSLHPLNAYPGEHVPEYTYFNPSESEFYLEGICPTACDNPIFVVRDSLGTLQKSFGLKLSPYENEYLSAYFLRDSMANPSFAEEDYYGMGGELFWGKGLGLVWFQKSFFEHRRLLHLRAYIKNGDTTGQVIPRNILLRATEPFESSMSFHIDQEKKELNIKGRVAPQLPSYISLTNMEGKKVIEKRYTGEGIDLSALPKGIYLAWFGQKNGLQYRQKVWLR